MAKRGVEWPQRAAKKPCCGPNSGRSNNSKQEEETRSSRILELSSSLLSSLPPHLLLAKRHHPPGHDHRNHKRPRYGSDALEARMRGLQICCETDKDDMRTTERGKENNSHPSWSSFLPELLRLICCRLWLADVPRFGAVCKHWNSCSFPVYPADATPILISSTLTDTGLIRCYSPCFNKMFVLTTTIRAPESRIFSAAADGWVILRKPNKTILFGNLLDGSMFETPEYEHDEVYLCTPRDNGHEHPKDCGIFGVYASMGTVKIQSWDGESWENFEEQHGGGGDDDDDDDDMEGDDHRRLFTMSFCCNPVLHKGLLYCLGQGGSLGVYDPMEIKWSVLHKPSSFGSELQYKNCYLVESQGELLVVLTGKNGTPIYVLRLNDTEMVWERMESLGGRALFTGTVASLSVAKPPESMANKVYLPRFYGHPEVIQAELTKSGDRLFFVPKPKQGSDEPGDAGRAKHGAGGDKNCAWCYDLELGSGPGVEKQFAGSKNLLQYVWVRLGPASPTDRMSLCT